MTIHPGTPRAADFIASLPNDAETAAVMCALPIIEGGALYARPFRILVLRQAQHIAVPAKPLGDVRVGS